MDWPEAMVESVRYIVVWPTIAVVICVAINNWRKDRERTTTHTGTGIFGTKKTRVGGGHGPA